MGALVGVNLRDLFPQHPVPGGWFDGKRIAIDGHNVAFRYLTSFRSQDGDVLRASDGRAIGHLLGYVNLVRHLRERGAEPIVVWDGAVHDRKRRTVDERNVGRRRASATRQGLEAELERGNLLGPREYGRVLRAELEGDIRALEAILASSSGASAPAAGAGPVDDEAEAQAARDELEGKRRELARAAFLPDEQYGALRLVRLEDEVVQARRKVTQLDEGMIADATRLLESLGVAVARAPHDGERYAAALCLAGHADAVATEDFDALVAGAPSVLRKAGSLDCFLHHLSDLDGQRLTREQLRHVAILCGTDFHPGVRGFGAKTAVRMLAEVPDVRRLIAEAERGAGSTRYHRLLRGSGLTLAEFDEVDAFLADLPPAPRPERLRPDPASAAGLARELGVQRERVLACFC